MLLQRIAAHLNAQKTPPYVINLDPAVHDVPFPANIGERFKIVLNIWWSRKVMHGNLYGVCRQSKQYFIVVLTDIRDTVKYKEVMKQYALGPNGGIVTSLNLFATRFDQVSIFCTRGLCLYMNLLGFFLHNM